MKIIRVTYSKTTTVNLGDYESSKFGLEVTAEVDEGESYDDVLTKLRETVSADISHERKHVEKMRDARNARRAREAEAERAREALTDDE